MDREPVHIDIYHRLGASLRYERSFGDVFLEVTAAVFNLYDRDNPWYRDPISMLAREGRRRIEDVYDLGV